MDIGRIGTPMFENVQPERGAKNEKSPTAADFAEMIRKLAGPEMLWEEQAPEEMQEYAVGDDTDARGVLASGRRLSR